MNANVLGTEVLMAVCHHILAGTLVVVRHVFGSII